MGAGTARERPPTGVAQGTPQQLVLDEPLLRGHHSNPRRHEILNSAKTSLGRLPESDATRDALELLNEMASTSKIQSWVLLRDRLHGLDTSLESLIGIECELVHLSILGSAKTGADVIPVLHSMCAGFMDAYASCLDSWRVLLRDVVERFDDNMKFDGKIQDYIVNMARFGSWPEDDAFVAMVQEVYTRRGNYGAICDICEKILDFDHEDAQYALPLAHIESSIASIADHAIAHCVPDDGQVLDRCASILKRRAGALDVDVSLPKAGESTPSAISEAAHSLAQHRQTHNLSPWISQYPTDYPFVYGEFVSQVPAMDPTLPSAIMTEDEGLDALERAARSLADARSENSRLLRSILSMIMIHTNKDMSFDADLQKYITDMARFGSGAADELAYRLLLDLCTARGMFVEVCDICEEMNGFEGADAQRMDASTLIEGAVGGLLRSMAHAHPPSKNEVIERSAALLESRSERLGPGRVPVSYPGDELN